MKNWKSTIAFFIFVGAYIYAMYFNKEVGIVEVAAYVALYSSLFMMFRSDFTKDMISKLLDNIKIGK